MAAVIMAGIIGVMLPDKNDMIALPTPLSVSFSFGASRFSSMACCACMPVILHSSL